MGIDLEFLWDKYGRFHLMILSLLMGTICWVFNIIVLNFLSEEYSSSYNCTLIYPLAYNKVHPNETATIIQIMSSLSEIIVFLLKDLFPIYYLLNIASENFSKKKYTFQYFLPSRKPSETDSSKKLLNYYDD